MNELEFTDPISAPLLEAVWETMPVAMRKTVSAAPMIPAIALGKFSAIPGSAFGAPGCIRFGYAGMSLDEIERLRQHLGEVVESVRPSPLSLAIPP